MADTVSFVEILENHGDSGDDARQEQTVRRKFWRTLKHAARQIPFMEDAVAGYYCAIDRSTPARVRTALFGALAYFVMPLDMIPDFIVGTGFADDATVLLGTLALVRANISPRHREDARNALADGLGNASQ